jgi:arginine deiminase
MTTPQKADLAAYGGKNWSPRLKSHRDEIGELWSSCGIDTEWLKLKQILLHPPGPEMASIENPEDYQMLEVPNWEIAREQHFAYANMLSNLGVAVSYVEPGVPSPPNLIFCADLFFMTPEGAILARPASTVRAGEERWVARRLADMGIPILKTLQGSALFEGADALWVNKNLVMIGRGLRTNDAAINQISQVLHEMGVEVIPIDLPIGTMHLMGVLRFIDRDFVLAWSNRLAWKAVNVLKNNGYHVYAIPDVYEADVNGALNFVTLGPREILMASGNPITRAFLESHNVICHMVDVGELYNAAGGIGCLTGILERELTMKTHPHS